MAVKDNKSRMLVTVENELRAEIADYRFAGRFKTESEAVRNLLLLGLAKNRETLDALERRQKGKKR